ncbi:uncharacterized protein BX664DRAFT_381897 [Halteromyces radiatus]|uniref:uncharacterized protein n=1 Tax=Halteromyces radiatus TaxID=101107 RepID=UPI00221F6417|nr:uncharacterized protein BX664DRAFT_381897 [Halteromyces radiatus]KAI8099327.1 hypothetical protein BX664DRAFT_381897 [Halteromyces radiatus]
MTKRLRSSDESDVANVLRQRHKHDPIQKEKQGQHTFALMMRAGQKQTTSLPSPSLFEVQSPIPQQLSSPCFRCPTALPSCCTCTFCEQAICQHCIQPCQRCNSMFCTACSVIDYSAAMEQAYCLSCFTS